MAKVSFKDGSVHIEATRGELEQERPEDDLSQLRQLMLVQMEMLNTACSAFLSAPDDAVLYAEKMHMHMSVLRFDVLNTSDAILIEMKTLANQLKERLAAAAAASEPEVLEDAPVEI